MEGVKKCLHCMTLHVQAMHNSPTAFSNHCQSTLVSLMRPNLCSIWAPLLVQFWKENIPDTGTFLRYILGNVLSDLAIRSWSKSNRLWFSFGNRNSTFGLSDFISQFFVPKKGIVKCQAFSNSRQFGSSEGPIKRPLDLDTWDCPTTTNRRVRQDLWRPLGRLPQ